MKFSFNWLKEYLETSASLDEITKKLTNIGLEVESVENQAEILAQFEVAEIIEAIPAPNSNKLKICQVKTANNDKALQIICGAKNARTGIKVAYAGIGSLIPANQMKIKKAKIAGIESNGMLCSARELEIGNDDAGIIEIDAKWPVGTKISEVFGLNDAIIEINVTPNRGDCLGIYGIARDLAASGIGTLKNPQVKEITSDFAFPLEVNNEAESVCNFATFRYFKNVENCESPNWLKEKLNSCGINSISAIVDITNYVMLVLNRPMHAYDAKKLAGNINIRFAKDEEDFTSLKDDEFKLDNKSLVISDDKKALGIAGIIGSKDSSCELETTEILLEAAFFDPKTVAYTGRKLNLLSDARFRFERGVDENTCESGIKLASLLISEICGGQASEIKIIGQKSSEKTIEFDFGKIKKLTGIEIDKNEAFKILSNLGFEVKDSSSEISVKIPSHRHDISNDQDLIEEITRVFGYDKIAKEKYDFSPTAAFEKPLHKIRLHLASQGMIETINWSFNDSKLVENFAKINDDLLLANPISVEMNYMRPNLMIGLLESYKRNALRGFSNLSLFEIGNVFLNSSNSGQKLMVCGIRVGKNAEESHYHDAREFDVLDVKKDFFDITEIFGLNANSLQINESEIPKYYHPHRSAAIKLGKNLVGYFGEIHPSIAKKFGIKSRINAFEIFIDALPNSSKSTSRKAFIANDLPIVERDFAFVVDKNLAVGSIIKTINSCDKKLIRDVNIFDIYVGEKIAADKKSVALRVKIQSDEKTLTSEEIDIISKNIITKVGESCSAILRD